MNELKIYPPLNKIMAGQAFKTASYTAPLVLATVTNFAYRTLTRQQSRVRVYKTIQCMGLILVCFGEPIKNQLLETAAKWSSSAAQS
ncbi:unnamed protein product [Macrosiphum euphorbiae]|uniref:HIG1 domain-containing protein n=1 Tax=Macrosiphum euphorbiae TaxID=13131 RepID=A0AAV0VTB4_9HEMI|nr:unnamed protein product [Macrosiphum euphorbiae]